MSLKLQKRLVVDSLAYQTHHLVGVGSGSSTHWHPEDQFCQRGMRLVSEWVLSTSHAEVAKKITAYPSTEKVLI